MEVSIRFTVADEQHLTQSRAKLLTSSPNSQPTRKHALVKFTGKFPWFARLQFLAASPWPGSNIHKSALVPWWVNETKLCPGQDARIAHALEESLCLASPVCTGSASARHTPRVAGGRALAAGWLLHIHLRERERKIVKGNYRKKKSRLSKALVSRVFFLLRLPLFEVSDYAFLRAPLAFIPERN